ASRSASRRWTRTKSAGSRWKLTKKSPASSWPSSASMPSVNEYPRRRMRVPAFSAGAASRMCASAGVAARSTRSNSPVRPNGAPLAFRRPIVRSYVPLERLLFLELDVVRAVLEAHQVARLFLRAARRRRPPEVELRPAHRHLPATDAGEVADGVEGDLRVVGAGLDGEIAVRPLGLELVAGKARERTQGLRTREAEALEERGAEAERQRQARGTQADCLAGVDRRAERVGRLAHALAGAHPGGRVRPGPEQFAELRRPRVENVERGEVEALLRRRRDPRLVLPVKGDDPLGSAVAAGQRT